MAAGTTPRFSLDLPVGAVVPGPAVLEQPDATTVIDPDLVARVDALGNVIVERKEAPQASQEAVS